MKIVFDGQLLLSRDKTGIAWNAHNLILELVKYPDHEYSIQCFKNRQIHSLDVYKEAGCTVECCNWSGYLLYKLLWAFIPVPRHMFFHTRADLTQFFNFVIPPGVAGKRITFIYDMAYKACPEAVSPKTRIWLEMGMRRTCMRANHIVTVSAFSKKEIVKYLNVPENKITVIPNAVDHTVYHTGYSKKQRNKVRKKYGIRAEYILYLGTIEPRKNLERLIGAYERLCLKRKQVPQLVLAGKKGWLCEGIYEKARKSACRNSILFTGYVSQKDSPLLMSGAKIFVFPSLYEGFGMPVLEAMACAAPVITSDRASLPEVVGEAGLLADPENEKELCGAMCRLLEDDAYRERLRMLGPERAKKYTWAKSAAMLMDVYHQVLAVPAENQDTGGI